MVQDLPGGARQQDRPPQAPGFRQRRTTFAVDTEALGERVRNGIRIPNIINDQKSREIRYQRFLRRVGTPATRPEFMVYEALERQGLRSSASKPPGLDFEFQAPILGGRSVAGGAVADFLIRTTAPGLVIRVQGEFFHFAAEDVEEADIFQRLSLESEGFMVVDILAQDVTTENEADSSVRLALQGSERETAGRIGAVL